MSEERHQCQRRSEIINLKLQRESEDVAAAATNLEAKVKVPPSRAEQNVLHSVWQAGGQKVSMVCVPAENARTDGELGED